MKGKIFAMLAVFAMVAIMFGSVSAQETRPEETESINDFIKIESSTNSITTDKQRYSLGEPVEITITTTEDYRLNHGPISSWITIREKGTDEIVKGYVGYVTWIAYPAGSYTWTWDQTYMFGAEPDGTQVSPGRYVAEFRDRNGDGEPMAVTEFTITGRPYN